MDQIKTGALIKQLRTDSGLTQKQLADRLCVSDKAVSKWECGNGIPDISLLSELAEIFGTDIQTLLSGSMNKNESGKGNMKKLRFYVCRECGNIITSASEASVTCCGSRLAPLEAKKAEDGELLKVEDIGGEWFISSDHEMKKEHYISFVAYIADSSTMMFRQYPEWDLQLTLPLYRSGLLVWYCTQHGLFYQDIRRSAAPQNSQQSEH
ncbi:MAG: helix-turn-helix domain-containing protein [Ruminococcus sp.]|nr:helix-turn-helix domain-containing protein [Ruminococcus sp.]